MKRTLIWLVVLAGCGSAPSVDVSPVRRAIEGKADQLTRSVLSGLQSSLSSTQMTELSAVDWATISVSQFVNSPATLDGLRVTASSIEQFGRFAQPLRTEQSGCINQSEVICVNIYKNMEVVFDRVSEEMKRLQTSNTKAIAFGSRANDVIASVMLVSAINGFTGQPGSYTDNFNQLVSCVPCVTPPTKRGSSGGGTTGNPDDPCGATGTWQINCPASPTACGLCGTISASTTLVTISSSVAKSGGSAVVRVNGVTANIAFNPSACLVDFGDSACNLSAGEFGFSGGKPFFDVMYKCAGDCGKPCGSPSCTITKQ